MTARQCDTSGSEACRCQSVLVALMALYQFACSLKATAECRAMCAACCSGAQALAVVIIIILLLTYVSQQTSTVLLVLPGAWHLQINVHYQHMVAAHHQAPFYWCSCWCNCQNFWDCTIVSQAARHLVPVRACLLSLLDHGLSLHFFVSFTSGVICKVVSSLQAGPPRLVSLTPVLQHACVACRTRICM